MLAIVLKPDVAMHGHLLSLLLSVLVAFELFESLNDHLTVYLAPVDLGKVLFCWRDVERWSLDNHEAVVVSLGGRFGLAPFHDSRKHGYRRQTHELVVWE